MQKYSAYKDSGIEWLGEVPEGWAVTRLKFAAIVNPTKGNSDFDKGSEQEVTFLPMERVSNDGKIDTSLKRPINDLWSGFTYFEEGDIIIAKITPCFENGKGAYLENLGSPVGFGSTEFHVLRPIEGTGEGKYLYYLTYSHAFRKVGEAFMTGAAGQKRIPTDFVSEYPLALPPLDEQRAIAAYLDRKTAAIDALVAKKRRLIERLAELRAAVIHRAVTKGLDPDAPMKDSGIEWLGEVPEGWEIAPLYARYEVQLGKMLDTKRIRGNNLAPYLRNVDVQWDHINTMDLPEMDFSEENRKKYRLRKGDILVCEGGEVGRAAIWKEELDECFYQKALHRLRPYRDEFPRFIFYVLRTAAHLGVFQAVGNPNTIFHLTAEKLRTHRFPFPPLDEQRAIAAYLDRKTSEIDGLIEREERLIERLAELRAALISEAVTGKIDVRDAVAA
jgi:restriction endonuclease S subunit